MRWWGSEQQGRGDAGLGERGLVTALSQRFSSLVLARLPGTEADRGRGDGVDAVEAATRPSESVGRFDEVTRCFRCRVSDVRP